jgi:hypothetical protein
MAEDTSYPVEAMERGVAACRQALVDYQAGLLNEEQLRRALYQAGMVLGDNEAWLLDVAGAAWSRYDGIGTERFPAGVGEGSSADRAFDAATLRRWQEGLRALLPVTNPAQ